MSAPDAEYQPADAGAERPTGADTTHDDYKSRTGQSEIPVVSDSTNIEDTIDSNTADSDAQLGIAHQFVAMFDANENIAKDDSDAIDSSNIMEGRTRGAAPSGGYREPGDEEGLPTDDGTSAVAGGPN